MSPQLILQTMLFVAGICVLASAGLVVATYYFLTQARKELQRLQRGPRVIRDGTGRPLKERV